MGAYNRTRELHEVLVALADDALESTPDSLIIAFAPESYGPQITEAHRLYYWDYCYEWYASLERADVESFYGEYLEFRDLQGK